MRSRFPEAERGVSVGRSRCAGHAQCVWWPRTLGALLLCLSPALVSWVVPIVAHAAPGTEATDRARRAHSARTVAKQALAAYRAGRYAEAIERYQAAHRILPEPRYLYALGTSYFKLGRLGSALAYLERFVRVSKDPAGARFRQRAARRIARIRRTSSLVTLDVSPAGARVMVDGQVALIAPIRKRQRLRHGLHRVTATLAGHGRVQKRVRVGPGRSVRVVLRLTPLDRPSPHLRPRGLRAAGWTTIALSGVSMVVAGVLGSLSLKATQSITESDQGTMWEPGLSSEYAAVGRYRTGAWVAGGFGAALLITGVVLLAVDGTRRRERRVWLQPTVSPGRITLCLGVRH